MGEALISRRGGGEKVTIDGIKADREYNLKSNKTLSVMCEMPTALVKVIIDSEGYVVNIFKPEVAVYKNKFYTAGSIGAGIFKYENDEWIKVLDRSVSSRLSVYNDYIYYTWNYNLYEFDGVNETQIASMPTYMDDLIICNGEFHGFTGGIAHYIYKNGAFSRASTCPISVYSSDQKFVFNNELYIAASSNFNSSTTLYKWNGTAWTGISSIPFSYYRIAFSVYDNVVHAYGEIVNTAHVSNVKEHWSWDGTTWTQLEDLPCGMASVGTVLKYNKNIYYFYPDNPEKQETSNGGTYNAPLSYCFAEIPCYMEDI